MILQTNPPDLGQSVLTPWHIRVSSTLGNTEHAGGGACSGPSRPRGNLGLRDLLPSPFYDMSTECSGSLYQVPLLVTILWYRSACVICCSIALLPISSKGVHPRFPTFAFISINIIHNIQRRFQLLESIDKILSISICDIDRQTILDTHHWLWPKHSRVSRVLSYSRWLCSI